MINVIISAYIMKKILSFFIFIVLLSGCSTQSWKYTSNPKQYSSLFFGLQKSRPDKRRLEVGNYR